ISLTRIGALPMSDEAIAATSVNGITVKLGRVMPAVPRLVPKLAAFLRGQLPDPPPVVDFYSGVPSWPMYANDRLGDCVVATIAHMEGLWTALGSPPEKLYTDEEVIAFYSAVGGYDPHRPNTDRGLVIADALAYSCRVGIGAGRDKAAGFVS